MPDANAYAFMDQVMGVGVPHGYDAIDNLLDRGADFGTASGSEGSIAFNVGSALSSWANSLGGGRNHIAILGDSNTQHVPADTWRWAQALKADLLTMTGQANGGEGFRHLGLPEWALTGTTTKIGDNTNFSTVYDIGPSGNAYTVTGTNGLFTWTLPGTFAAHDRWEIYGIDDDFISMQVEYSANGGAFTASAWDFSPTTGVRLVKQAVATPITTTLRIRGGNGIFHSLFVGAAFYNGTSGLIVHNLGQGGNDVDIIAGPTSSNRLALLADLQPKLTIVWTGTNEFHHAPGLGITQMSLDDWYTTYSRIVSRARLYGDVLMIYPQATQLPNTFSPSAFPYQQAAYEKVARAVAMENDAGFVSIHQLWGAWEKHNARARAADAWHINQAGHEAVKRFIYRVIERNR